MTTLEDYQSTFTEHQCFVQNIAIQMLGSSYNLKKSNGYKSWLSKQEAKKEESKESPPIAAEQTTVLDNNPPKSKPILKVKKSKIIRVEPIYKKLLTFLSKTLDIGAIALEGITNFGVSSIPPCGGVYWITNHTTVLFMGTTSDLRKNVMLAIKSIRKKTSDEILIESITKFIDEKSGITSKIMCIVFLECDDSKDRIRIKNRFKNETQFAPSLE